MAYKIETECIQGGYHAFDGEPQVMPIIQSTTFRYDSAETLGELFDLKRSGHFYTRLSNPTLEYVEKKLTKLEGGVGAMITASGQSASLLSILNIVSAGGHVVCASAIYGGTFNLFNKTLRDLGIDFTFVPPGADEATLLGAFRDNTRAVFAETLSNPSLNVLDIEQYAKAAHANRVPLIVDNTFPTPVKCRPFEFGADIVVHSTSKYMDGHACALGGAIIDGGKFDWANGNFPAFTTPDDTYHGVVYAQAFGEAAYITKARVHLMRDLGVQASPQNAFLLNLGLETLHLRMDRHCENALKVAEYLQQHPKVAWINYPGLKDNANYALAQKYLPNGASGVISFGIKGGRKAAAHFMDATDLISIVTHVADARTCLLHPASTTHRQLSDEQLLEAGVGADLIRLSIGIEHVDDIIADLENAFSLA